MLLGTFHLNHSNPWNSVCLIWHWHPFEAIWTCLTCWNRLQVWDSSTWQMGMAAEKALRKSYSLWVSFHRYFLSKESTSSGDDVWTVKRTWNPSYWATTDINLAYHAPNVCKLKKEDLFFACVYILELSESCILTAPWVFTLKELYSMITAWLCGNNGRIRLRGKTWVNGPWGVQITPITVWCSSSAHNASDSNHMM